MTISGINPILQGTAPDPGEMYANFKPVRYRYVMAYLHDEKDPVTGEVHKAGEVMYVLPLTGVNYSLGLYAGTEMSGNIYLPDFYIDLMAHPPSNVFERRPHPDRTGTPVGAMFECGNRAIYIMRNEKVVWGGILWSRSYTSGNTTLAISALSWEGYLYYRLLRKSVVFLAATNAYKIWWAVIQQTMNDFKYSDTTHGSISNEATRYPNGNAKTQLATLWTGITRAFARVGSTPAWSQSNADVRFTTGTTQTSYQGWPLNAPNIEMPETGDTPTFLWKRGTTEVKTTVNETFRGYDMNRVGDVLEQWADTETVATDTAAGAFRRFEYRVMSWFDASQQIFRQRWLFGEMEFANSADPYKPTGILREFIGRNTAATLDSENSLTFDYPGHISSWSLTESMEECATRVIVMDQGDGATKHAEYCSNAELMLVPNDTSTAGYATRGKQGWRLYDRLQTYDNSSQSVMMSRGDRLLQLAYPPQAAQISDLNTVSAGQRTSKRATDLSITLHTDPATPFPEFGLGDWATFAIEDPFYGGKMYLQRRIIGYSVAIDEEQETDYSNETITLELTDDTHISEGE